MLCYTKQQNLPIHVNSQCACCECVPCAAVKMIHSIAIIKVPLWHDCSRIFCADTHAEFLGISHITLIIYKDIIYLLFCHICSNASANSILLISSKSWNFKKPFPPCPLQHTWIHFFKQCIKSVHIKELLVQQENMNLKIINYVGPLRVFKASSTGE